MAIPYGFPEKVLPFVSLSSFSTNTNQTMNLSRSSYSLCSGAAADEESLRRSIIHIGPDSSSDSLSRIQASRLLGGGDIGIHHYPAKRAEESSRLPRPRTFGVKDLEDGGLFANSTPAGRVLASAGTHQGCSVEKPSLLHRPQRTFSGKIASSPDESLHLTSILAAGVPSLRLHKDILSPYSELSGRSSNNTTSTFLDLALKLATNGSQKHYHDASTSVLQTSSSNKNSPPRRSPKFSSFPMPRVQNVVQRKNTNPQKHKLYTLKSYERLWASIEAKAAAARSVNNTTVEDDTEAEAALRFVKREAFRRQLHRGNNKR